MPPRWGNGPFDMAPGEPADQVDWEEEGFSEDTEDPGDDVGTI